MKTMLLTVRRWCGGKYLITYLREGEHCTITVPVGFWRRARRLELGGRPWPRPFNKAIVELAGQIVESKVTGVAVEPPAGMASADVMLAVKLAERIQEGLKR